MKPDINTRCANAINDVQDQVQNKNWKNAIEALVAIAEMMKSSGYGKQAYLAIVENMENQLKRHVDSLTMEEFATALQNKDHYLSGSVILMPPRKTNLS